MPIAGDTIVASDGARRWRPEAAVTLLAGVLFLGCLGSVELWGKREQRLAAEVLDTVVDGRWLVARIQGRPRLEKPPLPRWTAAALAVVSGRCDEWTVRLPGALAALGTVGLTYLLGRRIGGRSLGLCAAMVLCTTPLFISESRQAGQDGPLALYTTLALYAAYRILEPASEGGRRWAIVFHVGLGLGFLCKGPMILMIVGATIVPYAILARRLGRVVRLLANPWGASAFLALALCWPVPVWLADPNAVGVWITEMGQKTGALPIAHRERSHFLLEWPVLVLPWLVAGLSGVILPFRRDRDDATDETAVAAVWFPWLWSIGTLLLLSTWAVAKPNYYTPCLPGWSLLAGMAWLRLDRLALDPEAKGRRRARVAMLLQWGVWLAIGALIPAIPGRWFADVAPGWFATAAVALTAAAVAGAWIGRRGGGALALLPVTAATALGVVIGYGVIAPEENATRGHRDVAGRIDRLIPAEIDTLSFFHELDEGLWFYLRGRRLAPVPGSQPRYSDSYDRLATADSRIPLDGPGRRIPQSRKILADWLDRRPGAAEYLLLRDKVYEPLAPDLDRVADLVFRESGSKRNGLILLRINHAPEPAAEPVIR
ncbi:MAG: glycosyltransferase family 39 protein [Paludisphaera borealis]|uniref:glycosyltransferase family 39 protein n=1 Tax=Paludisphaera borealis TaxID=1387353 RepID=UPI00283AD499|nr:glycosyltransferase family 39 protein [Paludisphaera borealis]MDR3620935.1 glycosyltransferase family 39 protein [Paludisphaera borealis]